MLRPLTPLQRGVDIAIATVYIALFVLIPLAGSSGGFAPALVALVLGAALVLRRWSPPLALLIAWIGAVLQIALGESANVLDAAIPPIVYACAAYGTRPTRWSAFTSSLIGGAIAGVFMARTAFADAVADRSAESVGAAAQQFATYALLTAVTLLLAWTIGLLVSVAAQSRSNRQEAVQANQQAAAEQERTRIARDMHDVVAHSLAVVIAQSDGARMVRRTDPAAVDEALETIGATARAALSDVRVLLQQLRYEGTTSVQPGLADLDVLVEQVRASGLAVDLHRDADADEVGTASQLAAFRIVQESLTNALRHGDRGRPATVVLARTAHGLEVEVLSGIDPARPPRPSDGGHGLIGMRERASAVQGDLKAGPDGDRFRVRAFLPSSATAALAVLPAAAATRSGTTAVRAGTTR